MFIRKQSLLCLAKLMFHQLISEDDESQDVETGKPVDCQGGLEAALIPNESRDDQANIHDWVHV